MGKVAVIMVLVLIAIGCSHVVVVRECKDTTDGAHWVCHSIGWFE